MPRPILTGNDLLDKLRTNGVYRNPNYNPKTKKGKLQPEYLVDNNAGDINSGIVTRAAQDQARIQVSPVDLGLSQEDVDRDFKLGINPINPYILLMNLIKRERTLSPLFLSLVIFLVKLH